jgi:hypothetical protein
MATYKRGYKAPKEEQMIQLKMEYWWKKTAQQLVFFNIRRNCFKNRSFVAKNQNFIIGIVGAVALVTIGYLVIKSLLLSQNNWSGKRNVCCTTKFQQATDGVASDSLYKL